MMDRIERKMKRLLLASIGAAAITREQSDSLLNALIEKGEEVIDRSGIRNECLRYNAPPGRRMRTPGWNSCAACPLNSCKS